MSEIDYRGPFASPQAAAVACDCGSLSMAHEGSFEAAALAQGKTVGLCHVAKGSRIIALHGSYDALGASTGLTWGYAKADGTIVDADYFKTVADTHAAGVFLEPIAPFVAPEDIIITATQTGAGAATGTITGEPIYNWRGGD